MAQRRFSFGLRRWGEENVAPDPFHWQTPDTRLRHIQYRLDLQRKRSRVLDEAASMMQPFGMGVLGTPEPFRPPIEAQPVPGDPSFEPGGRMPTPEPTLYRWRRGMGTAGFTVQQADDILHYYGLLDAGLSEQEASGRLYEEKHGEPLPPPTMPEPGPYADVLYPEGRELRPQGWRFDPEKGEFTMGLPSLLGAGEGALDPAYEAVERFQKRFLDPIAAGAVQAVGRAGPLGGPSMAAPTDVMAAVPGIEAPRPREGFQRELGERTVNPFAAWAGDDEEERLVQEVLMEAGLPAAILARVLTDPLWLVPGVGITKVRTFTNLVRQASRLKGAARTRILNNPTVRQTVDAIMSEAGGGRPTTGKWAWPKEALERPTTTRPPALVKGVEEAWAPRAPRRIPAAERPAESGLIGVPSPPEPPRLPTIAETKARAQAPPPEVRAQMMGEVEDVRVPLQSWDDFHASWGPRYQENWWTKIEDTVGGPLARTPEEKVVRAAFVRGDLYREIQRVRGRALTLDWVGRHQHALGLNSQGVAKRVPIAPGADVSPKWAQRLEHITEHPEKYTISPEQQVAFDEAQDIYRHVLQTELREGVDVMEVMGGYWHRLIKRTPEGKAVNASTSFSLPRVKPAHARSRAFGDIEELFAWDARAGGKMKLGSAIEGMGDRVSAATDAIANRRVVNELRNLGVKPSERISAEIAEEARAATQAYKGARAAATKKGSTLAERAAATEAEVRLVNAQRTLKAEAKFAMERRPKVMGRLVTEEAAEQMGRYLDAAGPDAVEEAFRLARASNIVGDLSAMGIQGWYTFWARNPTWWNATFKSLEALVHNPYRYVTQNIDAIEMGTRYGHIVTPEEFLLRRGGKWSQRFVQLPVIRNTQNSFEWWTFVAQTERSKAAQQLAKTPDDLFELGEVLRHQTGVSLTPGLTRWQRRGTQALFAPKFLAALLGSIKDVAKPGVAGHYARRTMATAFGGAMASITAANIAQGRVPNFIDPDKAGFFGIPVGEGYLYPMGPFQPFVVALFRSGRAAQDLAQGETPRPRDLQAWVRFAEGKLNKYERALVRAAEALGIPIGEVRGRPFRGPEIGVGRGGLWGEAEQFGPIGLVQAARGISEGAPITGAEVAGIRTTVRTPYQTLQQGWQEEYPGRDFNLEVDYIVAEANPDLSPLVEAARERSLDYGTPSAVMRQENLRVRADVEERYKLPQLAADYLAGNTEIVPELMERYRGYKADVAVAISAKMLEVEKQPETPEGKALQAYGELNPYDAKYADPRTKEPDWDLFKSDQQKYLNAIRSIYPALAAALLTRTKAIDPSLEQIEPTLELALDLKSEALDKRQHRGISREQEDEMDDFLEDVRKARLHWRERYGAEVSVVAGIRRVGEIQDKGSHFLQWAILLRPGTNTEKELRTPEYNDFLTDPETEKALRPFFPEFYETFEMAEEMFEREAAGAR